MEFDILNASRFVVISEVQRQMGIARLIVTVTYVTNL